MRKKIITIDSARRVIKLYNLKYGDGTITIADLKKRPARVIRRRAMQILADTNYDDELTALARYYDYKF